MASNFTNLFNGKPYSNGVPGTSSTGLSKLDEVRLPKQGSALGRLAHAISRLPKPPSSRGNASDLFLP